MHQHEEPSITAAHIVQVKGLNIEPLTMAQAIIIQGFSGLKIVPAQLMEQDMAERGWANYDLPSVKHVYEEDFLRLARGVYENEMDDFPDLTKLVYNLLVDKMDNDPFACWDSRVDVLVATHLNHKTQAAIRVSLELEHEATVTFTERPGPNPQTWIVIDRPDPAEHQLNVAVTNVVVQMHGNTAPSGTAEIILPMSLPSRVEPTFWYQIKNLFKLDILEITRGRFTRHQTKLVLTWGSGPGALAPTYMGEQVGRDNTNHAIKASTLGIIDGVGAMHVELCPPDNIEDATKPCVLGGSGTDGHKMNVLKTDPGSGPTHCGLNFYPNGSGTNSTGPK